MTTIPADTKHTISSTITSVCQDKNITCLHAIESGSRAWGFSSPDSDYDVRLIYCHEPNWYLRLFDDKDSFEYIQNDLFDVPFDIGGWDIKKALQLIYKSNAVIFEWLASPIVYQQHSDDISELQQISRDYFNPISAFHHYKGMAKTASESIELSETLKLKKLFYLLRALLACTWVQTHQTPPPVVMQDMFDLLPLSIQTELLQLIDIKTQVDESHQQTLSLSLQQAIQTLWDDIQNAQFTPKDKPDITPLNRFYQRVVFNR